MKKKTFIITGVILLASLLIPIPQALFTFILGALLISSIVFLLITVLRKKLFYPAPKIFTVLLTIIVGLELHFTKNLIVGWDYIVFGNLIAKLNYVIGIIVIGLLGLFNIFFIAHFICKEALNFDTKTDINSKFFTISQNTSLTPAEVEKEKNNAIKTATYYSKLQTDHKRLMKMSLITLVFAIIQIVICFFKRYIILEPTVGNVVGFNFFIFIYITMLAITVFIAIKRN